MMKTKTREHKNTSEFLFFVSVYFIYKVILKYLSVKASSIFLLIFSRYFLTK